MLYSTMSNDAVEMAQYIEEISIIIIIIEVLGGKGTPIFIKDSRPYLTDYCLKNCVRITACGVTITLAILNHHNQLLRYNT